MEAVYRQVDGKDSQQGDVVMEGAANGQEGLPEEVTAKLGAALLFISEGVRWGEGPQLASMAVRMLPSLMRLQVCLCARERDQ